MALRKVKIGSFVEKYNERCGIPNLTVDDISGISRDKEFFEPSKQVGADTSDYKVVPPTFFACNLMHVGRDRVLPISMNHTDSNKVVSGAYTVFRIIDESLILRDFFFMYLKSEEKDRFFWFNTDSSVRDGMDWEVFCELELLVPSIDIQKKYVRVYNALIENANLYQKNLADMEMVCVAYIEHLKKAYPLIEISAYIEPVFEKNMDNAITLEQGINIEKQFITPQRSNSDLSARVIVRNGQFAYCTQLNNENVAIAYRTGEDCVVSPVYDVFRNIRQDVLDDGYLFLWLIRPEFGRYMYWLSEGTSYEFLKYENLSRIRIPIPDIHIQRDVVKIHEVCIKRKALVEELKGFINKVCPVLIAGAIQEGGRA